MLVLREHFSGRLLGSSTGVSPSPPHLMCTERIHFEPLESQHFGRWSHHTSPWAPLPTLEGDGAPVTWRPRVPGQLRGPLVPVTCFSAPCGFATHTPTPTKHSLMDATYVTHASMSFLPPREKERADGGDTEALGVVRSRPALRSPPPRGCRGLQLARARAVLSSEEARD